jgi:hypothetical protein
MRLVVGVTAVLALASAGCGERSTSACKSGDSTSTASGKWETRVGYWRKTLLAAAGRDSVQFPTPTGSTFDKRLSSAASEFCFRVVSTEFVRAPQGSPLVIVESSSPARFSRDAAAIVRRLDPNRGGREDWQGWDYEGLFLGAQDENGEPFVAVFNFMRDHGGGQWARSEDLYPHPHG